MTIDFNPYSYFIITITLLFGFALMSVFVWHRFIRAKHTRERFAFVSLRTFALFLGVTIPLLFARNFVFEWLVQALNSQFGWTLPAYKEDSIWISVLVFCIATGFLYLLIRNLYFGWNGLKSTRQANMEDTKQSFSLYRDAYYYLKHKEKLEIYQEQGKGKKEVFSEFDEDTRRFHIKAAHLLKLYDAQYDIDVETQEEEEGIENDWHRQYKAFIGRHRSSGLKVGVFCLDSLPKDEKDTDVSKYLKRYGADAFEEHLMIIKGEGQKQQKQYGATTFTIRYESELLDSLIDFSDYKRYITKQFDQKKLANSDRTLQDTYTPLGGQIKVIEKDKLEPVADIENVESYILDWVNNSKETEQLVVLGDYGQGKTVLTQKIVKEMLSNPKDYQRIPILIELRGISPRNRDDVGLLSGWANRHQCKAEAVLELHKAGKLLVILDGFDEMDLVADTELLYNHFNQIWGLAKYPNAKLIVTGRPNLFADDIERRDALGIVPQRVYLPYSKAIALSPMTQVQIEDALRAVQPSTKKEILTTLGETSADSSIRELLSVVRSRVISDAFEMQIVYFSAIHICISSLTIWINHPVLLWKCY